jgi:hypothetical protein
MITVCSGHAQSSLTDSSVIFFHDPQVANSDRSENERRHQFAEMGLLSGHVLFAKSPRLLRMFLEETHDSAFAKYLRDNALIFRFTPRTFPNFEWDATATSPCQWLFGGKTSLHKHELLRLISPELCNEKRRVAFASPTSILRTTFSIEVQHMIARLACTCGTCQHNPATFSH